MKRTIVAVLLAAGRSTRFGGNKLLHPMEDGTPMVLACAQTLLHAGVSTIAVVSDSSNETAGLLSREPIEIFRNPRADDGMGTSIACGVAARPDADGWIIALADMPWIPESAVQTVAERLDHGADIVAPVYRGRRGHPVGFSTRFKPALMQLQHNEGARSIIEANPNSLELFQTEDAGVVRDLDRPTD